MKFFTTDQIRLLDQYTIEHEPIASIDLMERAADALYREFIGNFPYCQPVCIIAGPGNNGGDALALARMLLKSGCDVSVYLVHTGKLSDDCEANKVSMIEAFPDSLTEFSDRFVSPHIPTDAIVIDGLFGSGLSRPLSGIFAETVDCINNLENIIVSIDIPSGLQSEELPLTAKVELGKKLSIVKANYTFSLQFPKLAFLLPENAEFVGHWSALDIGIHADAIQQTPTDFNYLEESDIIPLLKNRQVFSHKGTFGHALIVAGSHGMAGAATLAAQAAMRSGAGLVTVHGPECNRVVLQTAFPEAIFQSDANRDFVSQVELETHYNAIAVGSGIGMQQVTVEMLQNFLNELNQPCVIDADALNIISQNKELLKLIPQNSILTPHPKEFERLFGASSDSYDRIFKARQAAMNYGIIIILKGAHTLIALPTGQLFFNSTGNSGMATAGSGDVLTGILVGLLAQHYSPEEAAKLSVFIHGRAGDLALETESKESLIACDIIANLGRAFKSLRN